MKNTFLSLLFVFSGAQVFAADANVYCHAGDQILSIQDEDGWMCRNALLEVDRSSACFTGARQDVIELLNSLKGQGYFDGTDGEFLTDAKFNGKSAVGYIVVDSANGYRSKSSIERCTRDFFTAR